METYGISHLSEQIDKFANVSLLTVQIHKSLRNVRVLILCVCGRGYNGEMVGEQLFPQLFLVAKVCAKH
jgi:hypothetical protein